jgi:hypothetical protein
MLADENEHEWFRRSFHRKITCRERDVSLRRREAISRNIHSRMGEMKNDRDFAFLDPSKINMLIV